MNLPSSAVLTGELFQLKKKMDHLRFRIRREPVIEKKATLEMRLEGLKRTHINLKHLLGAIYRSKMASTASSSPPSLPEPVPVSSDCATATTAPQSQVHTTTNAISDDTSPPQIPNPQSSAQTPQTTCNNQPATTVLNKRAPTTLQQVNTTAKIKAPFAASWSKQPFIELMQVVLILCTLAPALPVT